MKMKIRHDTSFLLFRHIDAKIYFHGPHQYSDTSGRMGYKLYRGETMQSQIRIRDIQLLERVVAKEDIEKAASNEEIEQKHNTTCSNENFDECLFSTLIQDMKDKTTENCTAPFITGYHNGNPTTFLMIKC